MFKKTYSLKKRNDRVNMERKLQPVTTILSRGVVTLFDRFDQDNTSRCPVLYFESRKYGT